MNMRKPTCTASLGSAPMNLTVQTPTAAGLVPLDPGTTRQIGTCGLAWDQESGQRRLAYHDSTTGSRGGGSGMVELGWQQGRSQN